MKRLEPEERVGDEEIAHFMATEVVDEGAPVLVLTLARVLVLEERRAVEARETVRVLRKVAGHPIEEHADPGLVTGVHEEPEVVRRPMPARRREIAGDLVAPRPSEGMLH